MSYTPRALYMLYLRVEEEYAFDSESEDIRQEYKLRLSRLPIEDRVLFVQYAEVQSLRKLAGAYGVSKETVYREIQRIRKELRE